MVILSDALTGYPQTYRLKSNTFFSHADWKDSMYRFSKFQEGSMIFDRGVSSDRKWKMNYNLYLKRMEMITERGDTIGVDYSSAIKVIRIANRLFFNDYPNGFVEIMVEGPVSLGAKHEVRVLMEDGNGERFRATDWGPDMTSRFDRLFTKEDLYYFLDQESNVRPANKRWILKLFPGHKEQIRNYLAKNSINFKVEQDLESLLRFCNNKSTLQ
jgi:hypothetical protein